MTALSLDLRRRWLAAMRANPERAMGRECDYSPNPELGDVLDPIGLLASLAPGGAFLFREDGHGGEWVPRKTAERLALSVGFPPNLLYNLCLLNDAGTDWATMAAFVEQHCQEAK